MAAVRFEAKAFTDARIGLLAKLMGWHVQRARGALLSVWSHCTEHNTHEVRPEILDVLGDQDGFAAALLTSELAELGANGTPRVRGTGERIGWLNAKRESLSAARGQRWTTDSEETTNDSNSRTVTQQTTVPNPNSGPTVHYSKSKSKSSSKAPTKSYLVAGDLTWPDGTRTDATEAAVTEWLAYRRESRKPLGLRAANALLVKFTGRPSDFAAAVQHSIANGWAGCFEPDKGRAKPQEEDFGAQLTRLGIVK